MEGSVEERKCPMEPIEYNSSDQLNTLISDFLLQTVAEHINNGLSTWMINTGSNEYVEYSDLEPLSRKVASWLNKKGFKKRDTVWVALTASEKLHSVLTGVWRANGIIRSSLLTDASARRKAAVIQKMRDLKIRWIFCNMTNTAFYLDVALKVGWPVYVITNGEQQGCVSLREIFEDDGLDAPCSNVEENDAALMLSSRGTTDTSIDAVHTHKTLIAMIQNFANFISYHEKPLLICSNLTHIIGIICPFSLLSRGRTGLLVSKPERREFVAITKRYQEHLQKSINKYKPSGLLGSPASIAEMALSDGICLDSVEHVYVGGARSTASFAKALISLQKLKIIIHGYWIKEMGLVASIADVPPTGTDLPILTVGMPPAGISIKIVDLTSGEMLGPNCKGEIMVKSKDTLCSNIENEETEKLVLKNGWFPTGDCGYMDENGLVFVVDPVQEVITLKNNKIFPSEVEHVLMQHPMVQEACVFGVYESNANGQIARAAVKIKPGLCIQAEDLKSFSDDLLEEKKQLRGGVFITHELPREKSGKVSPELLLKLNLL